MFCSSNMGLGTVYNNASLLFNMKINLTAPKELRMFLDARYA
jgi:hypothetical protein